MRPKMPHWQQTTTDWQTPMTVLAQIIGSGPNGVIHVGYRKWIAAVAAHLGVTCIATNAGEQVHLQAQGEPRRLHELLLQARRGSPRSRVLAVYTKILEE